jgi:Ca2+-transporting ATPase
LRTPDLRSVGDEPALLLPDAHRLGVDEVIARLDVDPSRGLDAEEAARRLRSVGPNQLPAAEPVPVWRRLVAQLREVLILILLAAAVISYLVTGELKTPLVVLVVVVFNSVLGVVQEMRAEASLDVLRAMLEPTTWVRREGVVQSVPAAEVVPGDVVLVEAGDRIPADGRWVHVVQLEVDESALTGEAVPVRQSTEAQDQERVPLGDRRNMGFMHTMVARGKGELVVVATGTATQIGEVADLLRGTSEERSPLQHQLDGMAHALAVLAGIVVLLVVGLGALRGQEFADLLVTAVALAVASIPEGLPAVTAVTLALGVARMARSNAIVKRLSGVETLGCTSTICTDKTGTLTLNQMTVTEVVAEGRSVAVTGRGYAPDGRLDGELTEHLRRAVEVAALCNDAGLHHEPGDGWSVLGDPTEVSLVVLASKAGVQVEELRAAHPRLAEIPFDSARRFMATVHDLPGTDGSTVRRVCVKGALDALLPRAVTAVGPGGCAVPVEVIAESLQAQASDLAGQGLRVLALADRDLDPDRPLMLEGGDPVEFVEEVRILALVGIHDPPRPEARAALEEARSAGIEVKVLTGDHAATAVAIARQVGLTDPDGEVPTLVGNDIEELPADDLADSLSRVTVVARVNPEHKLRIVEALQARGEVVAVTGDGVNDAPALKRADIGVAMGITGSEVSKEAATMVLTDDNFATIVRAVAGGRAIYANIVKFVRFQLSTTLGFAVLFLGASLTGVADGKPFTAIAILWVNIIMDGPPAMALGMDPGDDDLMRRPPRPRRQPLLTRPRWEAIGFAAAIMALGTLGVLAWAPGPEPVAGTATVAGTMAFNTFVLFQMFNIFNARSDNRTVFRRQTLTNRWLWSALAGVISLQVAATHVGPMQGFFDVTGLSLQQWLVCLAVASSVLWAEELRKVISRARAGTPGGRPQLH